MPLSISRRVTAISVPNFRDSRISGTNRSIGRMEGHWAHAIGIGVPGEDRGAPMVPKATGTTQRATVVFNDGSADCTECGGVSGGRARALRFQSMRIEKRTASCVMVFEYPEITSAASGEARRSLAIHSAEAAAR